MGFFCLFILPKRKEKKSPNMRKTRCMHENNRAKIVRDSRVMPLQTTHFFQSVDKLLL